MESEGWRPAFAAYASRKRREAESAYLCGFRTLDGPRVAPDLVTVGNEWTISLFDGAFYVHRAAGSIPSVSLVLVQSIEGNTGAADPAALGGGLTDKHLVYEGLSRVAADAVLAGARSVDEDVFFSVWHPQLVSLRASLDKPRHPVQVIVTSGGRLDLDHLLLANVPETPLALITTRDGAGRLSAAVRRREWVRVIACGDTIDMRRALTTLSDDLGVQSVSVVGGRTTAASLLETGLVRDLYLTTSPVSAGEPGTGLSLPPTLGRRLVVAKSGNDAEAGVRFEHWALGD